MTIQPNKPTLAGPAAALQALSQIVSAVDTWVQVHEAEESRRTAIRANRDIVIEDIRTKRDLFMDYLDRSFDERETNFRALFAALDSALGDSTTDVAAILNAITVLAAKSPFNDLHDIDLIKQRLADPDEEWEV